MAATLNGAGTGAISGRTGDKTGAKTGAGATALAPWFCCSVISSADAADTQPKHPMNTHKNIFFCKKFIFRPNLINVPSWISPECLQRKYPIHEVLDLINIFSFGELVILHMTIGKLDPICSGGDVLNKYVRRIGDTFIFVGD